jgi:glycosyl transferase family 25
MTAHQPTELQALFVISIRNQRLLKFEARLGAWCQFLTVVEGVNGKLLNMDELLASNLYIPTSRWHRLSRGELGCYLSHKAVWQYVVDSSKPYAMIMEDDCQFCPETHAQRLTSLLDNLRKNDPEWKILLLCRISSVKKNRKILSKDFVVPGRSWGLHCYIVSCKGAKMLLDQSKHITEAVDTFVSTRSGKGVYALVDNLCEVDTASSDTTGIK